MDVVIDNASLDREIAKLNASMDRYGDELHLNAPYVVKRQAGLLVQTLMNVTPPADPKKTKADIEKRVGGKFEAMSQRNTKRKFDEDAWEYGGKSGSGDVYWYGFYPDAIFGISRDSDQRKASVQDLYNLYFKTKIGAGGRLIVGRRGKQRVNIWKTHKFKKATVNKLIKRIQDHVGRMKAGWGVSWKDLGSPSGLLKVGKWVTDKIESSKSGKYGFSVNGLGVRGLPSFTLVNRAKGVSKAATHFFKLAVKARLGAMAEDIKFGLANPTKWRAREGATWMKSK